MGKKKVTRDQLRAELEEKTTFRLKREAKAAGVDSDFVKEADSDEDLIEAILEAKFGDDDEEKPKKTAKKGKGKKKASGKGKKKPKEEEEDGEPEGDDGEEEDDGEDDGEEGDDGEDDGEEDDGEEDDEEEEKPKPKAKKTGKGKSRAKAKSSGGDLDEVNEKLDAAIDGIAVLRKEVAELKEELAAVSIFVPLTLEVAKAGLLRVGKKVGTKGLKKRFDELTEEATGGGSEDD